MSSIPIDNQRLASADRIKCCQPDGNLLRDRPNGRRAAKKLLQPSTDLRIGPKDRAFRCDNQDCSGTASRGVAGGNSVRQTEYIFQIVLRHKRHRAGVRKTIHKGHRLIPWRIANRPSTKCTVIAVYTRRRLLSSVVALFSPAPLPPSHWRARRDYAPRV